MAIIPIMIPFARISRKISTTIYLSPRPVVEKLSLAFDIEIELDSWLQNLPEKIRPGDHNTQRAKMMLMQVSHSSSYRTMSHSC